jgi:TatD DNase family protein
MLANEKHRSMVSLLPTDRLLTETDGPFIELGNRKMRPSDVGDTVKELARAREIDEASLTELIRGNLKRILAD